MFNGCAHPLNIGKVDDHSWMKRQNRITFARCGIIDPLSISEYEAHGGGAGLAQVGVGIDEFGFAPFVVGVVER